MPPVATAKVIGLRERNKLDKLRRIKDAALDLFVTKGFDDTTTREIAIRAGVGLGTVFVYAATKRDLLFLIVNDDLERTIDAAAASVCPERSLLENLLTVHELHYRCFAQQPVTSRLALREMTFYEGGAQGRRFHHARDRLIGLNTEIVRLARQQGAISSTEDTETIGLVMFAIYQVEVRRWLASETLDLADGIDQLRRQLMLVITGLAPRPDALSLTRYSVPGQGGHVPVPPERNMPSPQISAQPGAAPWVPTYRA